MFNLTHQERKALLFIGALLILGGLINYLLKINPALLDSMQVNYSSECKTIDINNATKRDLIQLPGIGEVMASRIISFRDQNGPFRKIGDLKKVKGVGQKKLELMKDYIKLP